MLKIITLNVNGIRAAARKGFFEWLPTTDADLVCLQEVRAHPEQITHTMYQPEGYHCVYVDAVQKGYSGVALYSRQKPDEVSVSMGYPLADAEGRYVAMRFGQLWVASIYFPSGTSGDERQTEKYAFMDHFMQHLGQISKDCQLILCGDYNIAHTKNDIKNWRGNLNHTGFLPEERAWMDHLFGQANMVDAFRIVNQDSDQYTWWSNRGRAWENNTGWRIDYQVISEGLKSTVQSAEIYKAARFSDHAPLIMTYDI